MVSIDREHPDYKLRKGIWRTYRDLYAGGEQVKANAQVYLTRRQKEPADVYGERISRVFYENYIGSIIDWYAATLFRREPILSFAGENDAGRAFFCEFTEDCDRKQTAVSDFFRRQFVEMLVTGAGYILVDFPRVAQKAANRAEEDALGASRAYLVDYRSEDLINWDVDDDGNFEWVVLRTSRQAQSKDGSTEPANETRWLYYDKECFRIYRGTGGGLGQSPKPMLVDEGRHGLAGLRQVPLFEMKVTEGLCADEQGGAAAVGALQQIERAGVGIDDGAVRDAGGLLGSRVEADCRRVLLHPTGAGGPVRVDGAGRARLPGGGGEPEPAEGRDLSGVLPDAAGGGRDGRRSRG